MSEWAKRVRVEKATYGAKGRSEFILAGSFESREEYELARQYLENLVNVGIKADMLDAMREELASRDAELLAVRNELMATRLVLHTAQVEAERLQPLSKAAEGLVALLGRQARYNGQEDPNAVQR